MQVLTKEQIEDAFWNATVNVLGLDPDAEATQCHVRISWPKGDAGNSSWKPDENIVFLRITPASDDYTVQRDITHIYHSACDALHEVVTYHRCFSVQWVCFGPDSGEDADAIRIGILRTEIGKYLRHYGIAMKPDIREPVRMPELDDSGDWWERHDLTAQCYILFSREYMEGMIEHVPVTVSSKDASVEAWANPIMIPDTSEQD